MLVTQTGELNTESDNDESIKRIELSQMHAPIVYDIDTETYTGTKEARYATVCQQKDSTVVEDLGRNGYFFKQSQRSRFVILFRHSFV